MSAQSLADRVATLERRMRAVEKQVRPEPEPVVIQPWWVRMYPDPYVSLKEQDNG
jgi:hypothetical protein